MATKTKSVSARIREVAPDGYDDLSVRGGVATLRIGYFYGITADQAPKFAAVRAKLEAAGLIAGPVEYGNKFTPFRGGDSVARGSHYWMRFRVT